MTVYYVADSAQGTDPLPQPSYDPGSLFAGPYTEGRAVTLPDGINTTASHNPSVGLYTSFDTGNAAPGDPRYYVLTYSYHFRANADPALIRVERTNVWAQIPIAELYRDKQRELDSYVQAVTYSAIEAGDPAWAWVLDAPRRFDIGEVNEFLQDRLKDITVDGDVKPYWPPGYKTHIIRQSKEFGSQKQYEIDSDLGATGWGALMKAKGQHNESTKNASWACGQDIDAAYDANGGGGWQALADINVQDPAYGWPPWWPVS
jgi:hypothetical protein